MQIELDAKVYRLLAEQVGAGRFPSVEAAIAALAEDDALRAADLEAADLSWAKPYIEQGLRDVAEGRMRPAAAVHAALSERFRSRV
jgi:predicted transcriptional regulator